LAKATRRDGAQAEQLLLASNFRARFTMYRPIGLLQHCHRTMTLCVDYCLVLRAFNTLQ